MDVSGIQVPARMNKMKTSEPTDEADFFGRMQQMHQDEYGYGDNEDARSRKSVLSNHSNLSKTGRKTLQILSPSSKTVGSIRLDRARRETLGQMLTAQMSL